MRLTKQNAILLILSILVVPAFLFGQEQQEQAAPPADHGSVEFGVRGIWGDVYGRPDLPFKPDILNSKFNEYGDRQNGFFIRRFSMRVDNVLGSKNYLSVQSQNSIYKNQTYLATFGQYGKFTLQFRYDQIPHIFTNTARTIFTETSPGVYTVPDSLRATLQDQSAAAKPAQTLPGYLINNVLCGIAIPPATQPPSCSEQFITPRLLRKNGGGMFTYWITPEWSIYGSYSRENEVGNRPIGAILNSSPSASATAGVGIELPEPIDYYTDTAKVNTEYGKDDWGVQVGYLGSFFQDNIKTMVFDNPFRLTNETATNPLLGRMDLYPDNNAQYINFAGAFDLGKYVRVMATINPGWMHQNDAFIPYTSNGAISTCGDGTQACNSVSVLPASSLNGQKQTLAMNYTAVSLPWKRVQLKATYRQYDYNNNTPSYEFTPSEGDVGIPDITSPEENKPYGYNRKTYELTANWFFSKRSSFKAGYQGEWMDRSHRDVERSVEHSFISALDLSPNKDLLFRLSYRHSDRKPDLYQDETASDPVTGDAITCTSTSVVFTEEQRCHRRFDEAARILNRADASIEYDIGRFGFDGSFETLQNDFNRPGGSNSPTPLNFITGSAATTSPYYLYGALKDLSYVYTFDVNYTISPAASLFAEYAHERYHKRMISRNRTPASSGQTILSCSGCDSANNDWESVYRDIFDTYTAGFDMYFKKKVYLTPYYSLSAGKGNVFTRGLGDPTIAAGPNKYVLTGSNTPQDYPETTTRIHEFAFVLKYNLREHIRPKLEYRYQQYDNRDYQTTPMTPYMGCIGTTGSPVTGCPSATAGVQIPQPSAFYPGFVVGDTSAARFIFLGVDQPSFHVHVLSATLEYEF